MNFSPLLNIRLACRFLGYWNSECPARTAESTPERTFVGYRHASSPGVDMGVAVNDAGCGVCRLRADLRTRLVTNERAHRRPIRHCRWRRSVEAREDAIGINDPATDNRQFRNDVANLSPGAREIVAVRDDEISELAGLDPSLLALFVGEPGRVLG